MVDGNVIRVISRLRKIGSSTNSNDTINMIWKNANLLVDPERPGDFNQSLMELGATICTPKADPACSKCPVRNYCLARLQDKDIEDTLKDCDFCLPKNEPKNANPVLDYPRKDKKTKVTEKTNFVFIITNGDQFCLFQRPKTGLLANMYEFPNFEVTDKDLKETEMVKEMKAKFEISDVQDLKSHGETVWKFSHITQTYCIWSFNTSDENIVNPSGSKKDWIQEENFSNVPFSTAMKKVFEVYKNRNSSKVLPTKRKLQSNADLKKQPTINQFFKRK